MRGSNICENCNYCINIGGQPFCSCENGCAMEQKDIEEVYGRNESRESLSDVLIDSVISGLLDE